MRLRTLALAIVTVTAGYLLLAPTQVQPVAWNPPAAPGLTGPYADNQRLQGIERLARGQLDGPEAVLMAPDGSVITGLHDGRVVRVGSDGKTVSPLVQTGGRPLGLAWHPDGRLIIADARKGLLALTPKGQLQVLSTSADGIPLGFTDDVVVSRDGRHAWFSDASTRWGYGQDGEAIMEHGGDGRLLRHDFDTGETHVVLTGLQFANGVALGPDEEYLLINETGAYRISRVWLKGAKAGLQDVFIDNLPGLPDNLTFNGKDRFWVALYTPRNPLLDTFAAWPAVRQAFARALQVIPKPVEHRAMALGLDTEGRVIANLQDGGRDNYSPITCVREHGSWLYFGSLKQDAIARLPISQAGISP